MATSMRPASCSWGTRSIRRASRTGSATSTSDGSAARCCGSRAPRTRSPGGTSSRGCWAASESGPRSIASRAATTRSGFEVRNGTTRAPARPSARPRPGSSWGGREEHLCTLADARFGRSAPLSPEVLEPDERPDRLEPLSTSCGYDEVLPQTQGPLAGPARLPALLHLRREAGGLAPGPLQLLPPHVEAPPLSGNVLPQPLDLPVEVSPPGEQDRRYHRGHHCPSYCSHEPPQDRSGTSWGLDRPDGPSGRDRGLDLRRVSAALSVFSSHRSSSPSAEDHPIACSQAFRS